MSRARGATSQRWAAPVCVVGFVLRFGGSLAKNVLRRQGPGIDDLHLRAELQIPGRMFLVDLQRGTHPLMELDQGLGPRLGVLPGVFAEGLHQLEVCALLIRDVIHEAKPVIPALPSLQTKIVIKESGKQIIHNSPFEC